jgi:hypothetical protein
MAAELTWHDGAREAGCIYRKTAKFNDPYGRIWIDVFVRLHHGVAIKLIRFSHGGVRRGERSCDLADPARAGQHGPTLAAALQALGCTTTDAAGYAGAIRDFLVSEQPLLATAIAEAADAGSSS